MPKFFSGRRDVYLEVADRYERYIRSGVLVSGDKLPSVRSAAEDMGVNPNTVQKAYNHLEQMGLIYTLPKKGVFVSFENAELSPNQAAQVIISLKESGYTEQELLKIISEVYGNDQHQ